MAIIPVSVDSLVSTTAILQREIKAIEDARQKMETLGLPSFTLRQGPLLSDALQAITDFSAQVSATVHAEEVAKLFGPSSKDKKKK